MKYGKDQVKDSPFRLKVAPGGDASKVKVSGEGIEKPRVGQLVDIIFDTTEAGNGRFFVLDNYNTELALRFLRYCGLC